MNKNVFIKGFVTLALGFSVLSFVTPTPMAHAENDPVYTSWRNNIAVDGYDPITFFTGTPLQGNPQYQMEYMGAIWVFSSRANLDLFKTNPSVFAPQYGGYCAWAVAHGKLAKGSPENWYVEDGRLFLNFNDRIQKKWDKKRPDFIVRADNKWPDILKK